MLRLRPNLPQEALVSGWSFAAANIPWHLLILVLFQNSSWISVSVSEIGGLELNWKSFRVVGACPRFDRQMAQMLALGSFLLPLSLPRLYCSFRGKLCSHLLREFEVSLESQ